MSSFDGLAKGHAITSRIKQDPTQALASCVYTINESVTTFQRLVNTLGTPNDTPQHRVKLLYTRFFIARLVNDTSAKLKQASDTTYQDAGALNIAGLAMDFESILREFQKAQRVAFEKEVQYVPVVPSEELARDSDKNPEKHTGGNPSPSIPSSSNNQRVISSSLSSGYGVNAGSESLQSPTGLSYTGFLNNTNQATTTTKLSFDAAKMIDGESTAVFTSAELKSHISECESYVVGNLLGKKLRQSYVKESLESQWKLIGDFSMTMHGEHAFLFKFDQEEDRKKVLEMGSVFIAKRPFIIRPWSISLEQNIESITSVPVWMHLKQVPLHLWNQLGLSRIASIVGTPIMTDTPTAFSTRMSYARALVEVAADCSFPAELPIQIDNVKFVVKAEYPWRPTSCSHCKCFGHSSAKCSLNPAPKVSTKLVKDGIENSDMAIQQAKPSEDPKIKLIADVPAACW